MVGDQPDAPKAIGKPLQAVEQVRVLFEGGTAELHQVRFLHPVELHHLQQVFDRRLAVGGGTVIHFPREFARDLREHVHVGVDHRPQPVPRISSRPNSLRRAGVVSRSAIDAYLPGATRPSVQRS